MESTQFDRDAHGSVLEADLSRRRVLHRLAGGGLAAATAGALLSGTLAISGLAWAGTRPAAAQAATATPAAAFAGETFVGATADGAMLVAVQLAAAAADNQRVVRAYLCDGRTTAAWLTGTARGNQLALHANDGTQFQATVAGQTVTGSFTLANGRVLTFTAPRATGVAGLYDATPTADGRVTGTGSAGQRLEGQTVETLPDGATLVAGTLAAPDTRLRAFAVFTSARAPIELRVIVLADGRMAGTAKASRGPGFISWEVDL